MKTSKWNKIFVNKTLAEGRGGVQEKKNGEKRRNEAIATATAATAAIRCYNKVTAYNDCQRVVLFL